MRLCCALAALTTLAACGPAAGPSAKGQPPRAKAQTLHGPIGTVGPIVMRDADPQARWVVYCQARKDTDGDGKLSVRFGDHGEVFGDDLSLYLNLEAGDGETISRYWGSDVTGAYLLVQQNQTNYLVDVASGQRTRLDSWGGGPYRDLRNPPASFDAHGRVLFHRQGDTGAVFVLRDLASGDEVEVQTRAKAVTSASIDETGSWIVFEDIETDTNGNGVIDVPKVRTNLASSQCMGPVGSYSTYGYTGDAPVVRALPVQGKGKSFVLPSQTVILEDKLLLKKTSGGYSFLNLGLQEIEVAPKECRDGVVAVHGALERILVGCKEASGTRRAWILGPDFSRRLNFELSSGTLDTHGPQILKDSDEVLVKGRGQRWRVNLSSAKVSKWCEEFELLEGELQCLTRERKGGTCHEDAFLCGPEDDADVLAVSQKGGRLVPASVEKLSFGGMPHGPMLWTEATKPKPEDSKQATRIPVSRCDSDSTSLCVVSDRTPGNGEHAWIRSATDIWAADSIELSRQSENGWALQMKESEHYIAGLAGTQDGQVWLATGTRVHWWDGKSWSVSRLLGEVAALHARSSSEVWAVGEDGMVQRWEGSRWESIPSPSSQRVTKVFSLSANSVWVVLDGEELAHWNGKRWTKLPHSKVGKIMSIWGCSDRDLWVAAFDGHLLHWNGKDWRSSKPFGKANIWSLHGTSCKEVWSVEATKREGSEYKPENARLWHWNGVRWSLVAQVPGMSRVYATASSVWILSAGAILRRPNLSPQTVTQDAVPLP